MWASGKVTDKLSPNSKHVAFETQYIINTSIHQDYNLTDNSYILTLVIIDTVLKCIGAALIVFVFLNVFSGNLFDRKIDASFHCATA